MTLAGPFPLAPNERLILDRVRRLQPVTRARMANELPLTQPWIHRLVDQLLARGLLAAGPPQTAARGKPTVLLTLVDSAAYSVGIELEVDSVRMCLVDLACRVVDSAELAGSPTDRGATLPRLAASLQRLLGRHQVAPEQLVGIGFCLPGFFIGDGLRLNAPEPLREWSLIDLDPLLRDAFGGLPVAVLNNATAAAVGENLMGVGRWAQSFCYLAFGYGFGAGVVIDGKPFFGRHGNAGEITLEAPDLELARRPALRYLLDDLRAAGVDVESIQHLRDRFDPRWPGVEAWLHRVQPSLDRVVNAMAGLFDPDAIVFGGEMPTALKTRLLSNTRFWGSAHRYGAPPRRPRLVLAEAGSHAAPLGAALLLLARTFFD